MRSVHRSWSIAALLVIATSIVGLSWTVDSWACCLFSSRKSNRDQTYAMGKRPKAPAHARYQCPKCKMTFDKPGTCPMCKLKLEQVPSKSPDRS